MGNPFFYPVPRLLRNKSTIAKYATVFDKTRYLERVKELSFISARKEGQHTTGSKLKEVFQT
jgi:hypothetical protein